MLVGQEFLIKEIYLAGKPTNTHVNVGGDGYVGILHLTDEFSLTLDEFVNKYGKRVHRFGFGDQSSVIVANHIDWQLVTNTIKTALTEVGHSDEFINDVINSFKSVLFDSLLQFQQDEYLAELIQEDPIQTLKQSEEADSDKLLSHLMEQP